MNSPNKTGSTILDSADELYETLVQADNPVDILSALFENCSTQEDGVLRSYIKCLSDMGYIEVTMWADNKPYHVIVKEKPALSDGGVFPSEVRVNINDDHSIHIGDGVKVSHSVIGASINGTTPKSFFERHSVICSILLSFVVGFVLMFSFWDEIVSAIEGLF